MSVENKTPSSLKGKKVMSVEDDNFLSDIIARKFSKQDCLFVHAKDGETALALIEKEMPDVVLLDILLPGMNGFDLLEKFKSNPKTKDIPVIILSNLGQNSDIEKGKQLKASRFLIKATVSLDEIIKEVGEVLREQKPA